MAESVATVPGFWFLAGGSFVGILFELAIMLVSRRRLRRQDEARRRALDGDASALTSLALPTRALEGLATLIPIALAWGYAHSIQQSRNLFVHAMSLADPDAKAGPVSQAMSGEMNATPMGLIAVAVTLALATVAVALAISARLRAHGLRRAAAATGEAPEVATAWLQFPGPDVGPIAAGVGAFIALGFGPVVWAAQQSVVNKTTTFPAIAGVLPEAKGPMFDRALDGTSALLDRGLLVARVGVVVAVLIAALLAWKFSALRARRQLLGANGRASAKETLVGKGIALGTIALAAIAFAGTGRLRQENRTPWPPFDGSERLMALIVTPDLDGPDRLEQAPVIHITPNNTGLDGWEADMETLEGKLETLAHNYRLVRPNDPFDGLVDVICQADTPIERISPPLRAAARAGFARPTFAFLRRQVTDRPLLGHRWRNIAHAAQTTAIENRWDATEGAAIIEVGRFRTCATLSAAIVSERRAGHHVALLLPFAEPPAARR